VCVRARAACRIVQHGYAVLQGSMGIFVNPGGFLHQTITLREVAPRGLRLMDEPPCEADTWFAGFGWTIANCRGYVLYRGVPKYWTH
jgi:hypothetical protein